MAARDMTNCESHGQYRQNQTPGTHPVNQCPHRGNAAANTALPQPPRTSQKVPINSAPSFLLIPIIMSPLIVVINPAAEPGIKKEPSTKTFNRCTNLHRPSAPALRQQKAQPPSIHRGVTWRSTYPEDSEKTLRRWRCVLVKPGYRFSRTTFLHH